MADLLDPKKITIISKDDYLFKSEKKIIDPDKTYEFHYNLINNIPYETSLQEIGNDVNRNVRFPPKIILDGKTYLFRRKKRQYNWELYKPGSFHDDKIIRCNTPGMFVIMNLSLDHDESIYVNDIVIPINPNNIVIKLVKQNEEIRLNSSLSEEPVVLIWFTVHYELSED